MCVLIIANLHSIIYAVKRERGKKDNFWMKMLK